MALTQIVCIATNVHSGQEIKWKITKKKDQDEQVRVLAPVALRGELPPGREEQEEEAAQRSFYELKIPESHSFSTPAFLLGII